MTAADDSTAALVARLARAERREAALAGVLRAVAEAGDDLDRVLFEIAKHGAQLTGGVYSAIFLVEGDQIALYTYREATVEEPVVKVLPA